jgi:Xaa-Pro aminopeptidase
MPQIFSQNFNRVNWEKLFTTNWKKLRAGMKEKGIDSLIVQDVSNVKYLTGYSPMYSYFMLNTMIAVLPEDAERPTLYPIWYYEEFVKEKFGWLSDVRPIPRNMSDYPKEFGRLGLGEKIGIDSSMLYGLGKLLENKLKGKIVIADDVLAEARAIKNQEELKVMEQAVAIAELGFERAFEVCLAGAREYQVCAEIEYVMRRAGAEAATHCFAASGENAASMQEVATDKVIRNGETVVFDFGALYEGYNAEFARTKFMGTPSKKQVEVFKLVYDAEQEAIKKIKPGALCSDVDQVSRKVLREAGWGPPYEFNYNLGHGIGNALWEYPIVDETSKAKFKENMVVAIEPAVYKHGFGGVRVEDMVLVTSSGAKVFSQSPYHYA